jgi:WD40 repeat protein
MFPRLSLLLLALAFVLPAFAAAPPVQRPAPRTDRAGDSLPAGAVARLGTLRLRHGGVIHGLAFSSDGKMLATAGHDQVARLWDAATGRLLSKLEGHTNPVHAVCFADRDRSLITGAWDNTIRVWDVGSGKLSRTLKEANSGNMPVSVLAVSSDGKRLASGGLDNLVRIWDLKSGDLLRRVEGHTAAVMCLAFSPDGKRLYSGASDRTVRAFEVDSGKEVRNINAAPGGKFPDRLAPFALSPDGKSLAVSIGGSPIAVIGDDGRKLLRRLPATDSSVRVLAWSPDGKVLASAGGKDSIHLWDPETGKKLRSCGDTGRSVTSLAFSPTSKMLASAEGCSVRLWNVADGKALDRGDGHFARIASVAFDPDSKLVATGSLDGSVILWDSRGKPQRRLRLSAHHLGVQCLAVSPRGSLLAVGCRDDRIRLWRADTGQVSGTLTVKTSGTFSLAFSPDGKTLASGGADKVIRLWNPHEPKELRTIGRHANAVHALAWLPGGKVIAAGSTDGIRLWDPDTGKQGRQLKASGFGAVGLACNRDGKTLVTLARGGVFVYETEMGRKLREMRADPSWLQAVAFSRAEGTQMVAAGANRSHSVWVWDADTGKELHRLDGHEGSVHALTFTPDGKFLITAGDDGTAVVWDLAALKKGPARVPAGNRELEKCWEDLGSPDAALAYRSMIRLSESPEAAVALLAERLRPAVVDARHLRLAADLGGKDASARAALAELTRLGPLAEAALRRALANKPKPTARKHIEDLLARLDAPADTPQRLRWLRGVEVLELIGTPKAITALSALAKGVPEAEQTREALSSLKRLEKKTER